MARLPRVLTIPASRPLLRTLAEAILAGEVVPGWPDAGDPLSLAAGTILLPNRRACRALRDTFAGLVGDSAVLLPRIAPIGDVDEAEWAFADPDPLDVLGIDAIPPAIGDLDRRLVLAGLVRSWAATVGEAVVPRGPGDPLIVGASTGEALGLAAELMRLMDQVATERVDWSALDGIVEASLDDYWRLALGFLKIATAHWPDHLAETGLAEPAVRRDRQIAAETVRLSAMPGPVVAAGSTGSIPATRDLLRAVAHHPRGALVLPGLDLALDGPSWQAIGEARGAAAHAHPQFGLKRLVDHVGIARADVVEIAPPLPHGREALLSQAMRPAATTDLWAGAALPVPDGALAGVTVVEAAGEREEALAIAIALRQVAEDPEATAALVTPDRMLARRVMAELDRWSVAVDDSGGRPLAGTGPAAAARLVAAIALDDPAPEEVLALAAHPSVLSDIDPAERMRAIAALELCVLRGIRPAGGLAGYAAALAATRPQRPSATDPVRRISEGDLAGGRALIDRIAAALAPLVALGAAGEAPLATLAAAHRAALDALGLDSAPEGGAELIDLMDGMARGTAESFALAPADYPGAFEQLLATGTVRVPGDPGARIRILGLVEARLLDVDTVVLAGLVEGSWPGETRLDPWLNRAMRQSFGIDPPERRIGLAAHDICQLMGTPSVILTRATKAGGVPTVASRWLQRLAAVLGKDVWDGLTARGEALLALARTLDRPEAVRRIARPNPKPPVVVRPQRLSVTAIETWQRDPYAIYARHVLGLTALAALDEAPGAAERGTIIHDAIDAYTREVSASGAPPDPLDRLTALGREAFAPWWDDPAVRAVWWPRFLRIAGWFTGTDAARRRAYPLVHAEQRGEMVWDIGHGRQFRLTTKADRIDVAPDGTAAIVDYKTGGVPGQKEVLCGLAPQMPLEAAILKDGGFAGIDPGLTVTALVYGKLSGRDPAGTFETLDLKDSDAETLAAETLAQLKAWVARFEREDQGYLSWNMPKLMAKRDNDYSHLARVREWSAGGAE
ncbi:double-strand break repair protein AddB [Phreatobacter sp.]|uniref:double-strand break repair protein AddB n=1 Tax=Phreatobacter sp. TaxID=1966341 RepID=UPI003F70D171